MSISPPSAITEALAGGALVLTDGEGPARTLRRALGRSVGGRRDPLAAEPAIFSIERWMERLWESLLVDGVESRTLLNRAQEHTLWRRAIDNDLLASGLLARDALARTAARSGWLGARYGLPRGGAGRGGTQELFSLDEQAWLRWAATVERLSERGGYLLAGDLPAALGASVARGDGGALGAGLSVGLGTELCLLDLPEPSPAVRALLTALETRGGVPIRWVESTLPGREGLVFEAEDEAAELQAAVRWAFKHAQAHPGDRIALGIGDLSARAPSVERVVREVFDADALSFHEGGAAPAAELSTGVRVSESGPVHAALLLLRWTLGPLTAPEIGTLLLTPWFGSPKDPSSGAHEDDLPAGAADQLPGAADQLPGTADQLAGAAAFDIFTLRREKLLRPSLTLGDFRRLLDRAPRSLALEPLRRRVHALGEAAEREGLLPSGGQTPPSRRPGPTRGAERNFPAWIESFRRVLEACGWLRAVSADPLATAARQAFDRALDTVATLSFDGSGPQPPGTVYDALRRVAGETTLRSPSADAAVQILTPGEIGGAPFDALWVLGMDDAAWPPSPAVDPLLPLAWQRRRAMPGTDALAEEVRARRLTERLAGAASTVVFSFAGSGAQEAGERTLSPLLDDLSLAPLELQPPSPPVPWPAPVPFGEIAPSPWTRSEGLSGGAAVLKTQAACPFRAFAERRLLAGVPEDRDPGLNARDRGTLLHRTLERFWTRLGELAPDGQSSRDNLLALLAAGGQGEALRASIDWALRDGLEAARMAPSPGTPLAARLPDEMLWNAAYLDMERDRLERLLTAWLALEGGRAPFTVVARERIEHAATIGPLTLSLRIDRIDRTDDGLLVLDYKTSTVTSAAWMSERPDEPQLPLYAVFEDAALFADEAAGEHGVAGEDVFAPTAAPDPAPPIVSVAFAIVRPGDEMDLTGVGALGRPPKRSEKMDAPNFAAQLDEWRRILGDLAGAFAAGEASVDPKSYPATCKLCEQRLLCRLDPEALLRETDDLDEDELDRLDSPQPVSAGGGLDG